MQLLRPSLLRSAITLALATSVSFATHAQSGNETTTDQPSAQRLERVELSARPQTSVELRRQSTAAKQIYDEEEIQKFGDVSVGDAIKRLPGVSLSGGGPALRGLGSYTRVLLNGEPAPPNFDLNNLTPSQVSRIEVTRAATADQTAEAIGGSINIILKEPPRARTRDAQLRVSYQYENPALGVNASWGERIQGGTAFNLPFSYFEWNNFNAQRVASATTKLGEPVAIGVREGAQHPYGRGYNASPTLNWKINDQSSLNTQAFITQGNWYWSEQETSRRIVAGQPTFADEARNQGRWLNARVGTQYNNNFDGEQRLELRGKLEFNTGHFHFRSIRDASLQRETIGENKNPALTQSGQYSRLIADSHTLTAGWNFEWRDWTSLARTTVQGMPLLPLFEGQDIEARVNRYAVFLQDEWDATKRLSLYAGARAERIEIKSKVGMADSGGAAVESVATVVSPMFHAKYKLDEKGEHLLRSSLTSTFKAPDPQQVLARPFVNISFSDLSRTNDPLLSDRLGNPKLKPELATGFDVAYERYFGGGGVASATVFYRHVRDLIRNRTTLQNVAWAAAPRYVSQPVNFDSADTFGLELEARGRAGTLLPFLFNAKTPLELRASVNVYESKVKGVPGPDNRLDRQQPWSATVGLDYVLSGVLAAPIRLGGSVSYTPSFRTQQTAEQATAFARTRNIDLYMNVPITQTASLRLVANNFQPVAGENTATYAGQSDVNTITRPRTWYGLILSVKG